MNDILPEGWRIESRNEPSPILGRECETLRLFDPNGAEVIRQELRYSPRSSTERALRQIARIHAAHKTT